MSENEKKGITVKIDADLHAQVRQYIEANGIYYLRCKPQPGDYDCYCFCYEREMLEQAMAEDMTEEENIGMEMNT